MGMYFDAEAGDKLIDGTDSCRAVLHAGSAHIEIWCEDYERHYGNVPADFTAPQINVVIRFYRAGEKHGDQLGRLAQQAILRQALGVQ